MRLLYFLLFFGALLSAQTKLLIYPEDQHSYLGGKTNFYKDFQKILLEKNLKPCENKNEFLKAFVVVLENDTAMLYEPKTVQNSENKCAQELTKEVVKNMPGWVSAKIDGKNSAAMASYFIFPDAFFDNFKTNYNPDDYVTQPTFEGGINAFRNEVMKRVDVSDFYVKGKGKVTVEVQFVVNTEGDIENLILNNSSGLKQYDEMILKSVSRIKKKWKPATIHGIPIKQRYRMPLSFSDI